MCNCYLILGASSDIGISLIRALDLKKNDIVWAQYYQSVDNIELLKKEIACEIIPIQADFLSAESTMNLVNEIEKSGKIPNHIVHIPSIPVELKRFSEIDWEDYENYIFVQVRSSVLLLQKFLPIMAKNKNGKIVFLLTSYTFNIPPKFLSAYVTAKYALLGLMKSLAIEYAGKKIRINAVSPSMIETGFIKGISEIAVNNAAHNNPMKRNANVHDVIPIIKYLLSEDNTYMTGVNIPVAGGEAF